MKETIEGRKFAMTLSAEMKKADRLRTTANKVKSLLKQAES